MGSNKLQELLARPGIPTCPRCKTSAWGRERKLTPDSPQQTFFCDACQVYYDGNPEEGGDHTINDRYPDSRAIARDQREWREKMRRMERARERRDG